MLSVLAAALAGLRARRRVLLAALGVAAAAVVVGTSVTVGYGLQTGFERSARAADLPHVLARFDAEAQDAVAERVRALPNLAHSEYRLEVNDVGLRSRGRRTEAGAVHVVLDGAADGGESARRGYAVVEGRDLADGRAGEVLVEQGLARDWGLAPGDALRVGPFGLLRIAGIAVAPDNVAFPLARAARVYLPEAEVRRRFGPGESPANVALLWLNDPERADVTLAQARVVAFGIGGLRFVTREGVAVLIGQAAGVVIALLVAFSLVAVLAAGTMLAAGAQAEVQRRLPSFGVQRAMGFTPGRLAAQQATEAVALALPAAAAGLSVGALAVAGPSADLLAALNELPPGSALAAPLGLSLAGIVALFAAAATWPAWRAARRPPAQVLRGGDLVRSGRARTPAGGLLALGARFAWAARARWLAAVATVGVCVGVVLLMLALAGLLERLRDDPATVAKRYQLAVRIDSSRLDEVRGLPGVAAAGQRYAAPVVDSFRLGEGLTLVAYPGDHTRFEAPPLAEGRRVRAEGEVEVGRGLADALGLRPGSMLAPQAPSGRELRYRVVGVVRALDNDGRLAYARAGALTRAEPGLEPVVAVRLEPGADPEPVRRGLRELGARSERVGGATTRDAGFLGTLASVFRGVGLAVGLVSLYALVQALAMTARERRGAVSVLRATGTPPSGVRRVFAGAALAVAVPAGLLGAGLSVALFAPLVSRLAAGYATLPLTVTAGQLALVWLALALLAAGASWAVARAALRAPAVEGLRRE